MDEPQLAGAATASADAALGEPQSLIESILSSLPEQVVVLDSSGNALLTNASWERYRQGHAASDSLHALTQGDNFLRFLIGHDHPYAAAILHGICDVMELRKLQFNLEYRDTTRDGQEWFWLNATPWQREGGGVVITQTNISSVKRLSAEHRRLVALVENTSDLIGTCDSAGKVLYMNGACADFYGLGEQDWHYGGHRVDWFDELAPMLARSSRWTGETTLMRHDDVPVPTLAVVLGHAGENGEISHLSLIARDISALRASAAERERHIASLTALNRQLEAVQGQLLQQEKMASIGQLAAGVAHEINNPIGYVNSNLGTLKNYLGDLVALVDRDEAIVKEAGDSAQLDAMAQARQACDYQFIRDDMAALLDETGEGVLRVRKIVQDLKDFSH
ncbi:MAG: PAS domain-containing protein, partial [Burkholderiales bacterium]|nr:PAS domain-containing protein [Burkholderiales bacterium]